MTDASRVVSRWNIANAVTVTRVALVPVFTTLLFVNNGRLLAFMAFAIAMITDRVDGELARRRRLVTNFGTIADPIADKALIGSALIGLAVLGVLPWWVSIVVIVREVLVTVLRFSVLSTQVVPASRGGKAKTVIQGLAIGLYILPLTGAPATVRWWLMAVALIVTVATGMSYTYEMVRIRRSAHRGGVQ
jgi:CDP-diacylglycerol---glycerol-3-phosphate 3-phosphatidyltransferase